MENINILLLAISIAISLLALIFSIAARENSIKRTSVEISIAQSREYQKLLVEIAILNRFIQDHAEVYDIIESIEFSKLEIFDIGEVNNLFKKDQREKLETFFSGQAMDKDLMIKYYQLYKQMTQCDSPLPEDDKFIENLRIFYVVKITSLINMLEYISMAFVQNIASSKVVYQSLHQSFFRMVRLLYYPISSDNLQKKDHYGTNIVELYREWQAEDHRRNKKDNKYNSVSADHIV